MANCGEVARSGKTIEGALHQGCCGGSAMGVLFLCIIFLCHIPRVLTLGILGCDLSVHFTLAAGSLDIELHSDGVER